MMEQRSDTPSPRHLRVLVSGSFGSPLATPQLNSTLQTLADSVHDQLLIVGVTGHAVNAVSPNCPPQVLVDLYDGLIVLGGADVDPAQYGQTMDSACSYGINPNADEFEITLLRRAVEVQMPVFGICRGMQLLNVAQGGTLLQDIGPSTVHNVAEDNSALTGHSVRILPQTRLATIFGEQDIEIRSAHHQAIGALGNELRVAAVAPDGIIEAIELKGEAWGVGVQWHPEDPMADQAQIGRMLESFALQCAIYAERRVSC